jgi:putative nucleotidyltransferase with HDIG domain
MDSGLYFKVRINTLIPGKPLTFDLHVSVGEQNILYLRAGDILVPEKLEVLSKKDSGNHFLVREGDRAAYKSYVHDQMISGDLDVLRKATVLRESSIALMEELYEHPDVSTAMENSKPIVREFIDFMEAEPAAMSSLISLSGHDFYTYNHSLDVAIYSLGLAEALGFKKAELEEMGLGALFHDIGKRQVSLDILTKKGPLSPDEWQQMQKHPQFGLMILKDQNVSDAVRAACFEHHESWAGNGYPQGIAAEEIHPFGRIVAITDTYDAMTTQRSYNVPLKPFDAVTMMKEKLASRYDPEMLKAMHSVLFKLKAAS